MARWKKYSGAEPTSPPSQIAGCGPICIHPSGLAFGIYHHKWYTPARCRAGPSRSRSCPSTLGLCGVGSRRQRARSGGWQLLYRVLCLSLVLLLAAGDGAQHDAEPRGEPLRVLFIGNSYTFQNDLPAMFAELMRSGGYKVEVDMSAVGG